MLRPSPTPGRSRAVIRAGRRWHQVAAAELPARPQRVQVIAGVSLYRQPLRPKKGMWDDRIETGCWTLAAALWKLGAGQHTGRFATTSKQLVWALGKGPLRSTWGAPPPQMDGPDAGKYWRAHRRSVSRWLDSLEGAGVIRCAGHRDNQGYWWRMEVELQLVDVDERLRDRVEKARVRERGWDRRRRRSRARGVKRDLGAIRRDGAPLSKAERRDRGIARRRGISASRRRSHERELLAHPFGDSGAPTVPHGGEGGYEQHSWYFVEAKRRGAHAHGVPSLRSRSTYPSHLDPSPLDWEYLSAAIREGTEERESLLVRQANVEAGLGAPFAAPSGAVGAPRGWLGRIGPAAAQIAAMAPSADRINNAALTATVQAWWLAVRGVPASSIVVVDDTADTIDARSTLRGYAAEYERLAAHRPPGWPTSGAAALLLVAASAAAPLGSMATAARYRELADHMNGDRRHGGRALQPLGDPHSPAVVAAGYESAATMRKRLTEQLTAAGDHIERYRSLRAAEAAAIEHERTGCLRVGADPDWDAPWNKDRLDPGRWPSPSGQRAWREQHYPLPLAEFDPVGLRPANRLLDPERYRQAIASVEQARRGDRVERRLAEDLLHAFHARRYGVAGAIARHDWRPRPRSLAVLQSVVEAWEALPPELLPPGWPLSGVGALLHLATWRDPGSLTLGGKAVEMRRPEHVPMAMARLGVIIAEARRHADRGRHIERSTARARRRQDREHAERSDARQRIAFRRPADLKTTETQDQLRRRIARQLVACGDHAAHHPSLEDAELALIEHERAGRLPVGPSPSAMRNARHEQEPSQATEAVSEQDWHHLSMVAAAHLPEQRELLARLSPTAVINGTLILGAANDEDMQTCRQLRLAELLGQAASYANVAERASILDGRAAAGLAPRPAELAGPADPRAARGDRYADERISRYAI